MRDPSWRAAAIGGLREPVQAMTVAAATALLVVAASADVLVVWTSGQAAMEQLITAADVRQAGSSPAELTANVPPDVPELAAAVDQRLDELDGYEPSVFQITSISWLVRSGAESIRPVVRANGRIAPAVLFHREGAIESLEVVAGPDATGQVWLPVELAEQLRLEPGDPLEVGFEPIGAAAARAGAQTTLAGTYATDDGRPLGTLDDDARRLPPAPEDLTRPAALVLGDATTIHRLGEELGDLQFSSLQAEITQPPRYEDLLRGVEQLEQLERDLFDADSELGSMVFAEFDGPEVRVNSGLRRITTQAVGTAEAVGGQIRGAATAGVLLAAATLAATIVAAARRRSEHTRLELVQGSAPTAVAVRAALVAAPGVVLGAALGRVVVQPLAGMVLPAARVPSPAVSALTPRAAAVTLVAVAIVLAVGLADARVRLATLGGGERLRPVPVVPMLLVTAGVVVLGVVLGPPRPPTDPLVMAMPVVVVAAIAVVVLRTVVGLVPTRSTAEATPSAGWLARRRLAGQSGRLVAVGTIVATAAGLVAHAGVLRTSGAVAVEAKAAAFAGAHVVVGVSSPVLAEFGQVPAAHTVVIGDTSVQVLPEEERATLLAVDPASFGAVATWPAGTEPEVLAALDEADGAGLPVLVVDPGRVLGDRGTLDRAGWWSLPYSVVGRPAALPGSDPGNPLLLTTQDALFARLGAGLDPRDGPPDPDSADADGPWQTQVWLDAPVDDAIVSLLAATPSGERGPQLERTLDQVRSQTSFLAAVWSLGVLGGLGVVVLALALLLLAGTRARAEDDAGLELAMLERLGIPPGRQRRAAVLERVLLVAVAGLVGIAAGTGLAVLVLEAADPAPQLVPALTFVLPTGMLAGLAGILVLGGLVAGLLDHRAAHHADIEEALRVAH